MAITIINTPQLFTPSKNPVIWQLQSATSSILYYDVSLVQSGTNYTINNQNYFTTPDYRQGSYMNLSGLLKNTVRPDIDGEVNTFSKAKPNTIFSYRIDVTEVLVGSQSYVNGSTYSSSTMNVFNGDLNRVGFKNYDYNNYVVKGSTSSIKFLTYKPNKSEVNQYSLEQLYFMHNGLTSSLNAVLTTYNSNDSIKQSYTQSISGLTSSNMIRLQVSPRAILGQFGVTFSTGEYYTIHLDRNGSVVSENRLYKYKELGCRLEPVNMLFANSLGGVDSYQFVNPQETISVTKVTANKNTFKIDGGVYRDYTGSTVPVFNTNEEVINVSTNANYVANSKILTDAETYWLQELFISDSVYVELLNPNDLALVPVTVKDTSYNIKRQKWNKSDFNNIQVNYTFTGDYIPSKVVAYGSGVGSSQTK